MTIQNEVPVPAEQEGGSATRTTPATPFRTPGTRAPAPTDRRREGRRPGDPAGRHLLRTGPGAGHRVRVIYFAVPGTWYFDFGPLRANARNLGLGLTFGLALLFIGIGAVQWARQLMDDREMVDHRHGATSKPEDVAWIVGEMDKVVDESKPSQGDRPQPAGRPRHHLRADAGRSRDLGLADQEEARRDDRDHDLGRGRPAGARHHLRADQARGHRDRSAGQRRAGESSRAHGAEFQIEKAKAAIIIVRWTSEQPSRSPSRAKTGRSRESLLLKICTRPAIRSSLWEQQTHHLLCPCHQSTFDLGDSGVVVFGPAARALLPPGSRPTRRATSSPVVVSTSRPARASSNGTPADFKEGDN